MSFGRNKLRTWGDPQWDSIDTVVEHECMRTRVAARFLPLIGPLGEKVSTVEADRIVLEDENRDGELKQLETLTVNETETTAIGEIFVQFALTDEQVQNEETLHTAVTLATRATNYLSQAEDMLIFRGQRGVTQDPLFKRIKFGQGKFGEGLLNSVPEDGGEGHVLKVSPFAQNTQNPNKYRYGERTFAAVADGISRLQDKGHYGPYALVLHTDIFADAHAPLATTLIMPADRIRPLMDKEKDREGRAVGEMFYGTGTLPPFTGLLMSLGGNTVDRVVGLDPTAAYLQETTGADGELAAGMHFFRVVERFALRLKDPTSLARLEFLEEVVPDRMLPMAVGTEVDGGGGAQEDLNAPKEGEPAEQGQGG